MSLEHNIINSFLFCAEVCADETPDQTSASQAADCDGHQCHLEQLAQQTHNHRHDLQLRAADEESHQMVMGQIQHRSRSAPARSPARISAARRRVEALQGNVEKWSLPASRDHLCALRDDIAANRVIVCKCFLQYLLVVCL